MPEPISPSDSRDFLTEPPAGATFRTLHVERAVRIYPIQEGELKNISAMNGLALIFFSIGSGLATFALGLITDAAIEGSLTDSARALVTVVVPMCVVLALGAFGIGIWALRTKSSDLKRIQEESSH